MILSHKYKFIFIKTTKTAGTSIEIALSKYAGPRDVVTRIVDEDEAIRRDYGGIGPQNDLQPIWRYSLKKLIAYARTREPRIRFYNHMPAREVRRRVGAKIWDSYYKFTVDRNPWDRLLSGYHYNHRGVDEGERRSILEFMDSGWLDHQVQSGRGLYQIDGEVAVDRICRYESLADELEEVRQHIGLPEPLVLPRAKGQFRRDRRPYREVLTDEERKRIDETCRWEIDHLGYEW